MSTVRDRVLTGGARTTGALLCLLLALLGAAWAARDLTAARPGAEVWWAWLGGARGPRDAGAPASSLLDPLLALGALTAAVTALRGAVPAPVAAGTLFSLATATVLLRAPLLWMPGVGRLPGTDTGLTSWAQRTVLAELALAAALLVVVAAGRRRADRAGRHRGRPEHGLPAAASSAYGVVRAVPQAADQGRPGRPRKGPARTAGVLLAAAGLTLAGGQVYRLLELGADGYRTGLFGGATDLPALPPPPAHWLAAVLALLALGAAVAALRRASWARPAAVAVAALLCAHGAGALALAVHTGRAARLAALSGTDRLELANAAFLAVTGLTVLLVAFRRGVPEAAGGAGGALAYGSAPGAVRPPHAPPPPSTLPPGW
ncbi:hypothetical protein [Streptomyces lydicus]|uniref:hypothetical protein n=1 Tax=Streptomyces lydicus TaxID=47763 RepID=UPI0037D63E3D